MKKEIKTLEARRDQDLIFPLSAFAFQYDLNQDQLERKIKETQRYQVWGMFADNVLAAKTHLLPLSVYIHGKPFAMGGVSSVATWPEYRRNGFIKDLLKQALYYMRRHGQTISLLFPFSFGFYRRYGWELVFNDVKCTIPMSSFKKQWDTAGYVRRIQQDNLDVLDQVYTAYAQQYTGMLKRNENWWHDRVLKDDDHIAAAFDTQHKPVGYVMYKVKQDVLSVNDIAFANSNARKLLYQFIAQHDSMAEKVKMTVPENDPIILHSDEPRFEQKINPYMMARIVDVHAFLQAYPYAEGTRNVALNVVDDFVPENTGTYQLALDNNQVNVTAIQASTDYAGITCTIQQLTMMLLGFKRPTELKEAGFLTGESNQIEALEQLIPRQQPYIADFF